MSDRPEYIKCARVAEGEDEEAEYEFVYEVKTRAHSKWVGMPDDPSHNTWEREAVFIGPAREIIEKFWDSGPNPLSQPDHEGQYALGSLFEATQAYLGEHDANIEIPWSTERTQAARARLFAATQIENASSRIREPVKGRTARTNKRTRSPDDDVLPTSRRRQESPPAPDGEEYRPITPPPPVAPRPMVRPVIGSILTFKKGKAVVQDRHREVQDARLFRVRGGLFLQQHLRKERELRLAEAKKRAEEAKRAAEEEARRIAEELAEAEVAENMAIEARIEEENARLEAEANERAARAAEWSAPRKIEEPEKPRSPPPLKDLLASALEDDDLPDFEDDDDEPATAKPLTLPSTSIFGAPNSLFQETAKSSKKKVDPYYWAKKLDEERKQKELLSRHPILKFEIDGVQTQLFIKDVFNEPPRAPNTPSVSVFADSIIDTVSTQQEVDVAITYIEQGWSPARSVARLAPVYNSDWPMLEVLALQLLVDGRVIISSENENGWRPIVFASEEEGMFALLGASKQLSNHKSTLLISMVRCTDC